MARRAPTAIPGRNGKASRKIKDLGEIRTDSREADSFCRAAPGRTSISGIAGTSLTPVRLERAEKSLLSLPDVDSRRVAEIKAVLINNSLQINADDIADAMIRLDLSLGG